VSTGYSYTHTHTRTHALLSFAVTEDPVIHRNSFTDQAGLAVTLSISVRKVLGSNLDRATGYPGWSFSWFSAYPIPAFAWIVPRLGHGRFLPNPFRPTI
jgi:hypothetical protein